jgi:DNA end-binding protein Ku
MASLWSGYLTFGLISMPVRLFAGARGERVSFHMLHRDDLSRVKQKIFCAEEDVEISRDDVVKGYEYRKGEYVVIEPEEIKKIEPRTAKAMEILEFVKAEEVDPIYFESSYYMVPEEAGRRPYALLQKALEDSNFIGVAKLTMHNREYTVLLRPYDGGIMLHTIYYQDEIREVEGFGPVEADVKAAEVKVAHQLIEALAAEWEPKKYHDTFQDQVKKLIKARLEGKEAPEVEKPRAVKPVTDLMAALKQSLAATEGAGKKKAPHRANEGAAATKTARKRSKKAA